MELLTLEDVRRMSDNGRRGPVVVRAGQALTPGARAWLASHRVEVVYPQGGGSVGRGDPGAPDRLPQYRTLSGETLTEKPEHMTHLKGNLLVPKDHPRIAFRGMIDTLEAETMLVQLASADYPGLVDELEEVLTFVRRFIRCDVLDEPVGEIRLCGYTAEELRQVSHYPDKYLGQPHFLPGRRDGRALLAVNKLRTLARRTELAAYAAFRDGAGKLTREDIILGLNRLSSLLWIMVIKLKAGQYEHTS